MNAYALTLKLMLELEKISKGMTLVAKGASALLVIGFSLILEVFKMLICLFCAGLTESPQFKNGTKIALIQGTCCAVDTKLLGPTRMSEITAEKVKRGSL